jgi:hypothetical protein
MRAQSQKYFEEHALIADSQSLRVVHRMGVAHRLTPRELKHLVHQSNDGGQQEYFYEDCHNVFTSLLLSLAYPANMNSR